MTVLPGSHFVQQVSKLKQELLESHRADPRVGCETRATPHGLQARQR